MIDRAELPYLTGGDTMATEASLSGASPVRGAREMTAAALLRYGIEAEWRKRAIGVVPAQPKARPEGQRQCSVPSFPHHRKAAQVLIAVRRAAFDLSLVEQQRCGTYARQRDDAMIGGIEGW